MGVRSLLDLHPTEKQQNLFELKCSQRGRGIHIKQDLMFLDVKSLEIQILFWGRTTYERRKKDFIGMKKSVTVC